MKNNKKILSVVLLIVLLLTTGCGKTNYITDKKGKIVINKENGQNLQREIFCRPSKDTETYKLYQKYEKQMKVKLSKLPECKSFKVTSNKTSSLWKFIFVKPLAFIILKLGYLFKSLGLKKCFMGVSLICIGLLIRIILLPFNIKTQNQSRKMQKAMPEIQKLEKKYANRTDQESLMLKSQEQMNIYKKYHVNPFLSCLLAFIQLPIFFAFLQAIYKLPALYEGEIFGWNLGTTPSAGIGSGNYSFIILVVLIILTTYFSFQYTMKQSNNVAITPDAAKQTRTMLIFMTVFIAFASFSLPTAIALYWVVSYGFMIIQTFITNLILKKIDNKKPASKKEKKGIKAKLEVKEGMKYGKDNKDR